MLPNVLPGLLPKCLISCYALQAEDAIVICLVVNCKLSCIAGLCGIVSAIGSEVIIIPVTEFTFDRRARPIKGHTPAIGPIQWFTG